MSFRTHLGRSLSFKLFSNVAVLVIAGASAVGALVVWIESDVSSVWLAPVAAVLVWTLAREIDPDHAWTAILASAISAGWILFGGPTLNVLPVGALTISARLVVGTTGRRPLMTDLLVVSIGGIAIGFTVVGWLGGFGLAIAILLNARSRGDDSKWPSAIAAVTALGSTIVLTIFGGLSESLPDIDRISITVTGILALILIVREPAPPASTVDARHGARLELSRLYTGRVLVGISIFAMTLAGGEHLASVAPVATTLALVAISNEIERFKTA